MAKITLDAIFDMPARVTDSTTPIFAVWLLKVTPGRFDRPYGEIASFMRGPGSKIRGCTGATSGAPALPVPVMSKKLEA
jgi:hypothetical protein